MPLSTLKCTIAPTCIDGARHQPDLSKKLSNPLHDTVPLYSVQRGNLAKNHNYKKRVTEVNNVKAHFAKPTVQ